MIPMAVFAITRVISKVDDILILIKMSWDVLRLVAGGFCFKVLVFKRQVLLNMFLPQFLLGVGLPSVMVGVSFIAIFMSTFMSNTASLASLLAPIMAALGV